MSKTIEDDIAYMRSLAEAGRSRPVLNGGALFWAGICFGAASLAHYGFLKAVLPLPTPWLIPMVWLGAGVLYGILCWLSISDSIRRYGKPNEMNRVVGSMWSGVGLGIFVIAVCLMAAGLSQQALMGAMALLAPTVLVLYALGWWVMSDATRQGWLRWVSLATFGGAIVTATMANRPEQFLAYTACLVLFATVPGLILMRAEKD